MSDSDAEFEKFLQEVRFILNNAHQNNTWITLLYGLNHRIYLIRLMCITHTHKAQNWVVI